MCRDLPTVFLTESRHTLTKKGRTMNDKIFYSILLTAGLLATRLLFGFEVAELVAFAIIIAVEIDKK